MRLRPAWRRGMTHESRPMPIEDVGCEDVEWLLLRMLRMMLELLVDVGVAGGGG
jgi:hypothetical protein